MVCMQEKDNITQTINTFLDREEVQKNKYKPREEQVKVPEASQRVKSQQKAQSSVQKWKSTSRPG